MAVVVDLPLVPVTPMILAGQRSMNRRISVVMGLPAARAAWMYGLFGGIAGDATTISGDVKSSRAVFSEAEFEGQTFQLPHGIGRIFPADRRSVTSTFAPCGAEPARDGDSSAEAAEAGDGHSFARQRFHAIR